MVLKKLMEDRYVVKSSFDQKNLAMIVGGTILGILLPVFALAYSEEISNNFFFYFGLPLVILAALGMITLELPNIKRVRLTDTTVEIESPLTRKTTKVLYTELDGFKIQYQPTRHGSNKSVLLCKDGKLFHETSDLYISNIEDIEKYLKTKVNYLGVQKFGLYDYNITRITKKINTT